MSLCTADQVTPDAGEQAAGLQVASPMGAEIPAPFCRHFCPHRPWRRRRRSAHGAERVLVPCQRVTHHPESSSEPGLPPVTLIRWRLRQLLAPPAAGSRAGQRAGQRRAFPLASFASWALAGLPKEQAACLAPTPIGGVTAVSPGEADSCAARLK